MYKIDTYNLVLFFVVNAPFISMAGELKDARDFLVKQNSEETAQ
jgi:hypothetical protein